MPELPAATGLDPGEWADWPWTLLPLVPEATRSAWTVPSTITWHFELEEQ